MKLNLTRPLAFFDLETTGLNITNDRIVEISILKVMPDGTQKTLTRLVNPTIPIPQEVTEIHGIKDEDVKDKPTFKDMANELNQFLHNCDLSGYNALKFDIPLLVEEFFRAEVNFDLKHRRFIDVQNIFHKMEQRTLKAAYKFYCGKDLIGAHGAEADTKATYEILVAQLEKYQNAEFEDKDGSISVPVKNDIHTLHEFSKQKNNADLVGHLIFDEHNIELFNFGKHKGKSVEDIFKQEPSYYDWMMKSDFPLSTKNVITAIKLRGFNQGSLNFG
ncbi:MAG: ribonuclease H-like domain-containing protein [Bacteroidetes bacterium]|nr:ribonuclease H-like domain-containing protein [Bacteroidota bacterium]